MALGLEAKPSEQPWTCPEVTWVWGSVGTWTLRPVSLLGISYLPCHPQCPSPPVYPP